MPKHVIRISDAEAASDFASLLAQVRDGTEIVIERDAQAVAVLHPAEPACHSISECLAPLPEESSAAIDPDFCKDVEAAINSRRGRL